MSGNNETIRESPLNVHLWVYEEKKRKISFHDNEYKEKWRDSFYMYEYDC